MDPTTSECSERETQILDNQDQISILAQTARRPVYVYAVGSHSLAYGAAYGMDDDNFETEISAKTRINVALIGMIRKPS